MAGANDNVSSQPDRQVYTTGNPHGVMPEMPWSMFDPSGEPTANDNKKHSDNRPLIDPRISNKHTAPV